jgi:hypothetical protein
MNIQHKSGETAELYVAYVLSQLGFQVLWPHGTQARYDLATDTAGVFQRIQVKKATWSTTHNFQYLQARISSRNKNSRPKYEAGEFEAFAFTDLNRVWVIPFDVIGHQTSVCLDSTNPKYKPQTKYRAGDWIVWLGTQTH